MHLPIVPFWFTNILVHIIGNVRVEVILKKIFFIYDET